MPRPPKAGLDYFPHDCDASTDEKIERLTDLHGNDGYATYFRLLERIYRTSDGMLVLSDQLLVKVLRKRLHVSEKKFEKILDTCVAIGLFDKHAYDQQRALTSSGIKKRVEAVKAERERKRTRYREFRSGGMGGETPEKLLEYPQKGKERKGKESIQEEPFLRENAFQRVPRSSAMPTETQQYLQKQRQKET